MAADVGTAASDAIFVEDLGNDTRITIGTNSILLQGVNGVGNNAITATDFLFT